MRMKQAAHVSGGYMQGTKISAIVAEYNPLHRGHIYQLQEVRRLSGADQILVLMSGDFVQRGEPAVLDKYVRTRMALEAGADLVLELPLAAATGSAGEFAAGAVAILDALGAVDELWFGSEEGEVEPLREIAEVLAGEPGVFREVLRRELASGASFPAAQEAALAAALSEKRGEQPDAYREELHNILAGSNNMLAISYMKELILRKSSIVPMTIRREGEAYNSISVDSGFASASGIRHALLGEDPEEPEEVRRRVLASLPEYVSKHLEDPEALVRPDDFSDMLFARLMYEDHPENYASVTEDLANRLKNTWRDCHSFTELGEALKTKNMTRSRINRGLLHILLDIGQEDVERSAHPEVVRILGMRDAAASFSRIRQSGRVTLAASVFGIPEETYGKDRRASDLYEWIRSRKTGDRMRTEYQRMPVKI